MWSAAPGNAVEGTVMAMQGVRLGLSLGKACKCLSIMFSRTHETNTEIQFVKEIKKQRKGVPQPGTLAATTAFPRLEVDAGGVFCLRRPSGFGREPETGAQGADV